MDKEIFSCEYNSTIEGTQSTAKSKLHEFLKKQEFDYCRRFHIAEPSGKFFVELIQKCQILKRVVLTPKELADYIIHGSLPYTSKFDADFSTHYSVKYVESTGAIVIYTKDYAYWVYPLTANKLKKLKVTNTEPVLDEKRLEKINLVPLRFTY